MYGSCAPEVYRRTENHPQMAAKAVGWIGLLYTLEKNLQARNATYEEIASERQAKAIPIMDAMEVWMEKVSTECTPSDSMGKALDYAYKLWPRLRRYTQDGMYHIDNNPVERNQRPTVIGRKNYLFSKSDVGAIDNAIFYSLIESCDIVGIDPLAWLKDVLDNLRDDTGQEEMKQMLPFYYKKLASDELASFLFNKTGAFGWLLFSNFASLSALVFSGTGIVSNRRERNLSPSIFRYTYRFGGKGRSSGSPFSIVPRQLPRLLKKYIHSHREQEWLPVLKV